MITVTPSAEPSPPKTSNINWFDFGAPDVPPLPVCLDGCLPKDAPLFHPRIKCFRWGLSLILPLRLEIKYGRIHLLLISDEKKKINRK